MPAQNLVNYINPFSQIYTYISNTYFLDVSFWRDISDFMFPCKSWSVLSTSHDNGLRTRMDRSQKDVFNFPGSGLSAGNIRKDSSGYRRYAGLNWLGLRRLLVFSMLPHGGIRQLLCTLFSTRFINTDPSFF